MAYTEISPFLSDPQGDLLGNPSYELPAGLKRLGVTAKVFQLQQPNHDEVTEEQRKRVHEIAKKYLDEQKAHQLGFQANMKLNYSETMQHYQDAHLNNIGDPFANGSFTVNTKFLERPLLDYMASLWNATWYHQKWESEKKHDTYWGFALSMGGTEGNLYGLWNGRDYLAGKVLLAETMKEAETRRTRGSAKKAEPRYVMAEYVDPPLDANMKRRRLRDEIPLCFFSKDAHYSLKKAMVILNIQTFHSEATAAGRDWTCPLNPPEVDDGNWENGWPKEVPVHADGSVDVEKLKVLVEFFAKQGGYSFLFCFNYGTVFRGAYDEVEAAGKALLPIFIQYGLFERTLEYEDREQQKQRLTRNGWWFHVDGALGAAYMPFIELAREKGKTIPEDDTSRSYRFDFKLTVPVKYNDEELDYPVVHSISMSGHKWIGAPVPCGIFMTKTKYQLQPPQKGGISYIGSEDTTFAGSRSGLSAFYLWDYFSRHSFDKLMEKAIYTQEMACYVVKRLKDLQEKKNDDLLISRPKLSLGVVFKRPTPTIVDKFSLSKEEQKGPNGEVQYVVHAYAMEHVTHAMVDDLYNDCLADPRAFDYDWAENATRESEVLIGW